MSLRLDDIVAKHRGVRVLGPICIDLEQGTWLSIVGANGAGKSTLLRILAGAEAASDGTCHFQGQTVSELRNAERAKRFAYLAQAAPTQFPFTVREYVLLGALPHEWSSETRRNAFCDVTKSMSLEGLFDRSVVQLSGGEFQRVRLARALLQIWLNREASVLILDEPLTSLDWKHQEQLLELLGQLVSDGLTVVDATHQFLLMPSHDDQVLVLSPRGEALAMGKPSLTITSELVQNAFELDEDSTFRARLRF